MKMRTFRATTMREAMAMVKAELGPDAVVMTTREIARNQVELVAALDFEPPEAPMPPRRPSRSGSVEAAAMPEPELLRGLYTELSEMRRELTRMKAERALAKRSNQQWDRLMEELKDLGRVMGLKSGGEGSASDALLSRLVAGGVEVTLARSLIAQVAGSADNQERTWAVADAIQSAFEPAPAIWDRDKPTVAALVGPTGVGKTTTLAKIAAQASLSRGMKVALVAADVYRIGAVDQVRTYADLLGVPWSVASDRQELVQSLNRFSSKDLVLVDTTGGNPWSDDTLTGLDGLLNGLTVERHLCVPASLNGTDLGRIVERYGQTGLRSLVITKVDEARQIGGVVSTVWGTDYQIAHVTTGQEVPGDIETPNPARLCQAVLG